MSKSTMQRILTKDLLLHPFKIQLTLELKSDDHLMRRTFVDWMLENQQVDGDFAKEIIFSDEAHFHLSGYVNEQNCRIWGRDDPWVIQRPLYTQRATVWCGFYDGGMFLKMRLERQ